MWRKSALLACILAGLAAAAGARAEPTCKLVRYAELPVTMVGLRPVVTAGINGKPVYFVVDSGAFYSLIAPEAATRLGLTLDFPLAELRIVGVGGRMDVRTTTVKQFQVGPFAFPDVDFLTGSGPMFDSQIVGALSQNFFRQYDVEYDLANGVIRLFKPDDGCADAARVYWARTWSVIPLNHAGAFEPQMTADVSVNGKTLHATFDTGAASSILSLKAAAKIGITPQTKGVVAAGVAWGFGPRQMDAWVAPVREVRLGDETVSSTRLQMAGIDLNGQSDILIGADFFLAHRVYVSSSQHRLYFTYNGGPVFNLDAPALVRTRASDDVPGDAETLVRRAAAFMARHDYPAAIADFDRAIALEPEVARHRHDRALAHVGARQPALALADLDEALRLAPDDAGSLMLRAGLRLDRHDEAGAAADFNAALARPGADPTVRLAVAVDYARVHLYPAAVAHYDRWIAEHPKHPQLADALNGRCRARAEWGRGLDLALADCDAALKLRPRTAAFLDSRGLVRLRLGRPDEAIADYDEALRAQPKLAWSLYARGLAERARGMGAAGDADVAAGLALDGTLAGKAGEIGLTPNAAAATGPVTSAPNG